MSQIERIVNLQGLKTSVAETMLSKLIERIVNLQGLKTATSPTSSLS